MPIDTRRSQLDALAKTGAPRAAVDHALGLLAVRENIARQQWQAAREAKEHAAANAATAAQLADVVREHDALTDAARETALGAHEADRTTRATERRQLRDVIDLDRLRETDDAREVLDLVADAEANSRTLGAEARRIALQKVRVHAAREKQLGGGPWFRALCSLTAAAGPNDTSRSEISPRYTQRAQAMREQVLRVASVVGVRGLVERALDPVAPTQPTPAGKPSMTVGPFWDRHPALRDLSRLRATTAKD